MLHCGKKKRHLRACADGPRSRLGATHAYSRIARFRKPALRFSQQFRLAHACFSLPLKEFLGNPVSLFSPPPPSGSHAFLKWPQRNGAVETNGRCANLYRDKESSRNFNLPSPVEHPHFTLLLPLAAQDLGTNPKPPQSKSSDRPIQFVKRAQPGPLPKETKAESGALLYIYPMPCLLAASTEALKYYSQTSTAAPPPTLPKRERAKRPLLLWVLVGARLPAFLPLPRWSPSSHLTHCDLDAQKLPLIPAKDAGEVLDKEPEKHDQEVPPVKGHQSLLVLQPQIMTKVPRENEPPNASKFEQCYFQINWPPAVLQRWATEKANREKNLNLVFNQEQTFRNREPEAKKGDHQESTEME